MLVELVVSSLRLCFEFELDDDLVTNEVVGLPGVYDPEILAVDIELGVDLHGAPLWLTARET